jgi:hypothetical protein
LSTESAAVTTGPGGGAEKGTATLTAAFSLAGHFRQAV